MGGMGMINQFFENFDAITDYYNFLITKTKNLEYVGFRVPGSLGGNYQLPKN